MSRFYKKPTAKDTSDIKAVNTRTPHKCALCKEEIVRGSQAIVHEGCKERKVFKRYYHKECWNMVEDYQANNISVDYIAYYIDEYLRKKHSTGECFGCWQEGLCEYVCRCPDIKKHYQEKPVQETVDGAIDELLSLGFLKYADEKG